MRAPSADPDILRLVQVAAGCWVVGFELKLRAMSWGDALDDHEMHEIMLRFVNLGRPKRMIDPNDPDRTI